MSKVILITGSNRGIGYEIAMQCGKLGFHVILSGRNQHRLDTAKEHLQQENIQVESLLLDVSSKESIENAANEWSQKKMKIDVLVNNAGIMIKGDLKILQSDENILYQSINTNSFGPLNVTKSFLQFMQSPGRIIMISSGGGVLNGNNSGWSPAYCISKTLLNAITKQLAEELENRNISVNAVCPGWVQTDMGGLRATLSIAKGAETPVWLATDAPQGLTGKFLRDKEEILW